MRRIFKWLTGFLLLVIAGGAVAAALGYTALRTSIPAANGTMALAGLSGDVRLVRDMNGVPHIEAREQADAVRGLGFAHAQDRLWQMHVLRMVAQGRLSEMFGKPTIETDVFLKTMDIEHAARKSFEALSRPSQELLNAYAEGVNGWMNRQTRLMEVRLPPEFLILGVSPEPWEGWQTVAILKVMALTLDSNMEEELRRLAFASKGFTPREIDELVPYGPRDNPPPLPDLRQMFEFAKKEARAVAATGESGIAGLAWDIGVDASNNWVVSGSRTESGKPLLANDPHLGLTTPSVFYLAHMATGSNGSVRNLIGATLPGTPLFLLGRNDRVAWGLTTTNLDAQDVFIERLNPENPDQYLTPTGWRDFDKREVTVKVKGEPDFVFTRRATRHGPVLPDKYKSVSEIVPGGHVAALQWTALAEDDTTSEAAIEIGNAGSVSDYLNAMRKAVSPMQSMVVADADGNIALLAPGRVPVRDPANLIAGRAPVPGWNALYDWKGYLPFEALPRIENPASGALATANANWLPPGYDRHITYDWDEHFRQGRVEELVTGANAKHTPQSMRDIQADKFTPALTQFRDEALAQLQGGAGQELAVLEALKAWDGQMDMNKAEPLIMTAWWRHFHRMLFEDELGKDYSRIAKGYMDPLLAVLRGGTSRDWCDNVTTPQAETCGIVLAQAFAVANDELKQMQGSDWKKWRWGAGHLAFGEHRPFSSVGPLAGFFTVKPESSGGSYTLLRGRTDFREKNPYANVHASAYRAWYDLGAPDASQFVISTGQSGHFLSPHYDDLAAKWAASDYIAMTTRREDYERNADGAWTLTPAAQQGN
ncbi:MAG: penicillin acylase family protein [Nitratireductor sp.]|nr:penicillin acylase family protein [Nitratireductor sp.]